MKIREIRGWHGELERDNLRKFKLNSRFTKKRPSEKSKMIVFNIDGVILNKQRRYEAVRKKYPKGYRFLIKEMNKPEYLVLDTPNIEFVELTNNLKKMGVEICYLTNRPIATHDLTVKQVRNGGFAGGMLKMVERYLPDKEFKKMVLNGLLMQYDILSYIGCLYPDAAYQGGFPVNIYIVGQRGRLENDCAAILDIIENYK